MASLDQSSDHDAATSDYLSEALTFRSSPSIPFPLPPPLPSSSSPSTTPTPLCRLAFYMTLFTLALCNGLREDEDSGGWGR